MDSPRYPCTNAVLDSMPSTSNYKDDISLHGFLDLLLKCAGKGRVAETRESNQAENPKKSKKSSDQMLIIQKRLRDKDSFISSLIKDNNSLKKELKRSKEEVRNLKGADKKELREMSKSAFEYLEKSQLLQSKLIDAQKRIELLEEKRQSVHIKHTEQIEKLKIQNLESRKKTDEYIATLKGRLSDNQAYIEKLKGYLKGSQPETSKEANEEMQDSIYKRMAKNNWRPSNLTAPNLSHSGSQSPESSDGQSTVASNMSEHALKSLFPDRKPDSLSFDDVRAKIKGRTLTAARLYLGEAYQLSIGYNVRIVDGGVRFLKRKEEDFTPHGVLRGREKNSALLKELRQLTTPMTYWELEAHFDELKAMGFDELPKVTQEIWGLRNKFVDCCREYLKDLELASDRKLPK